MQQRGETKESDNSAALYTRGRRSRVSETSQTICSVESFQAQLRRSIVLVVVDLGWVDLGACITWYDNLLKVTPKIVKDHRRRPVNDGSAKTLSGLDAV